MVVLLRLSWQMDAARGSQRVIRMANQRGLSVCAPSRYRDVPIGGGIPASTDHLWSQCVLKRSIWIITLCISCLAISRKLVRVSRGKLMSGRSWVTKCKVASVWLLFRVLRVTVTYIAFLLRRL